MENKISVIDTPSHAKMILSSEPSIAVVLDSARY